MDDRRSRIKFRMTYILRFILGNKNPHEIHEGFMLSNQVILLHNSPSTGYRTYQLPIRSKLTRTYQQVA